jgi:hypothetical protein
MNKNIKMDNRTLEILNNYENDIVKLSLLDMKINGILDLIKFNCSSLYYV